MNSTTPSFNKITSTLLGPNYWTSTPIWDVVDGDILIQVLQLQYFTPTCEVVSEIFYAFYYAPHQAIDLSTTHQGIQAEIFCATGLCRLLIDFIIRGIMTHNSDAKTSIHCTTATQNLLEVLMPPPYSPNRQENLLHFLRTLCSLLTLEFQSLSSKYSIWLSYLNVSTLFRIWSQYRNSVPEATQVPLAKIWRPFCSVPPPHILVPRFIDSNVSSGIKISYFQHRGSGTVPQFRIMIVSSTFWCIKFICRLGRLVSLPGHLSTKQLIYVAVHSKSTRY